MPKTTYREFHRGLFAKNLGYQITEDSIDTKHPYRCYY